MPAAADDLKLGLSQESLLGMLREWGCRGGLGGAEPVHTPVLP